MPLQWMAFYIKRLMKRNLYIVLLIAMLLPGKGMAVFQHFCGGELIRLVEPINLQAFGAIWIRSVGGLQPNAGCERNRLNVNLTDVSMLESIHLNK